VVLAIAAGLSGVAVALSVVIFGNRNPPKLSPLFFVIDSGFNGLAYFLPIGIAIAVLRNRLWDIDIILRRTVTYAIVSGALAIIYFGANVVAQEVIGTLGGQRNEVAIVASTLAVAALFSPVRRRVQNAIDRRFNRQRYDADKVVADFAEYAAHETDLAALQARIVGVVAETIQPRQVTMWVRGGLPPDGGPQTVDG
jgi:predicted transcriptional regulator